jgi:hypothetical protein
LTFAILEDRPFKALEKSVEELPEYGNNGAPVHQRSCFRTRILGLYIDDDYTVHLVKWMINIYPRKNVALGLNRLSCLI